jgi:hypothetical protein
VSGKKIKGIIISHWRDDMGEIVVSDDDGTRSLYCGDVLQSRIRLDRPEALIEDYNMAMMSALIFSDSPRMVLLIGLGGCALVHSERLTGVYSRHCGDQRQDNRFRSLLLPSSERNFTSQDIPHIRTGLHETAALQR